MKLFVIILAFVMLTVSLADSKLDNVTWTLEKSVFAPRIKDADSQEFYDFVKEIKNFIKD